MFSALCDIFCGVHYIIHWYYNFWRFKIVSVMYTGNFKDPL